MKKESQIFRDISWLPQVAHALDSMAQNSGNQIRALESGLDQPHMFDDWIIDRTIQAYEKALDHCSLMSEQLNRWLTTDLRSDQRSEVERLIEVNQQIRAGNERVLDLCSQIKQGTIDRIMEMDDCELGIAALAGKRKPPFSTSLDEQLNSLQKLSMPAPVQKFEAVLAIHQFVESILTKGGGDQEIINHPEMMEFAIKFIGVKNSAQAGELDHLMGMFAGFHRFSKIFEMLMGLLGNLEAK
jgi:hypothetical protein